MAESAHMSRVLPPRREESPPARPTNEPAWTSLESLLALGLCAIVVAASMAFVRRSSGYSRRLEAIWEESMGPRPRQIAKPRPQAPRGPRPELVIVVCVDGLRPDRLEIYGHERETTPNLATLSAESILFEAVAAQSSHPLTSLKSLLTGKYPATLMLEQTGADLIELSSLRASRQFLLSTFSAVQGGMAAGFEASGFRTAGFVDGPWIGRGTGFEAGFGTFDDEGGGLAAVLEKGLAWLDPKNTTPAFLFLHAEALRCPYPAEEPFRDAFCKDHSAHSPLADWCGESTMPTTVLTERDREALQDHYDGAVRAADEQLGGFLDGLRANELYERALIVLTSAHGESLGEREMVGHGGLFAEQLLVPLVLKFPSDWEVQGASSPEPVELVDLLPSLFALCRVKVEEGLDGRTFLPTLFRGVRGREYLVAQSSFEEVPGMRSSAATRTILNPGRWQVLLDGERSEARFVSFGSDPLGRVATPVESEEYGPLLDLLMPHERAESHSRLHPPRELRFSGPIQAELEALGYGQAALAGQREASDLR